MGENLNPYPNPIKAGNELCCHVCEGKIKMVLSAPVKY